MTDTKVEPRLSKAKQCLDMMEVASCSPASTKHRKLAATHHLLPNGSMSLMITYKTPKPGSSSSSSLLDAWSA